MTKSINYWVISSHENWYCYTVTATVYAIVHVEAHNCYTKVTHKRELLMASVNIRKYTTWWKRKIKCITVRDVNKNMRLCTHKTYKNKRCWLQTRKNNMLIKRKTIKTSENFVLFHCVFSPVLKHGTKVIFVPCHPSRSHSGFSLLGISVPLAQKTEAKGVEAFYNWSPSASGKPCAKLSHKHFLLPFFEHLQVNFGSQPLFQFLHFLLQTWTAVSGFAFTNTIRVIVAEAIKRIEQMISHTFTNSTGFRKLFLHSGISDRCPLTSEKLLHISSLSFGIPHNPGSLSQSVSTSIIFTWFGKITLEYR